jgi:hypothetical protein
VGAPARVLEPEWLDELPAADRRARRSRADLRRINLLMGNARLLARALAAHLPASGALRIADLGAGDGSVMLRVAQHLGQRSGRPGAVATLVDRAPAVPASMIEGFSHIQWRARIAAEDIFDFLSRPGPRFDAIVANLFLHHFERDRLDRLLALAAGRTALFIACEPRRSRFALHASRLLWVLGCNDVTRHDAVVSVRAGFRGDELSRHWPRAVGWTLLERATLPFSHLFVARRDAL